MAQKIANYLRTYRRRSAFSQKELAFLLGYRSGSTVPRFERQQRRITLGVAASYQVIFGGELRDAFPAIYTRVEEGLSRRMEELYKRLKDRGSSRKARLKLRVLQEALSRVPKASDQQEV